MSYRSVLSVSNCGPSNPKLTLKINSLRIKHKAQNFASWMFSEYAFKIGRKKGNFFYHSITLRRYIKHSRQCFIGYPNTSNFISQNYSAARRFFNSLLDVWISRWNTVSRVWYITWKSFMTSGTFLILFRLDYSSCIYQEYLPFTRGNRKFRWKITWFVTFCLEASENMGCDLNWCYFYALLNLSSWCGYNDSLSRNVAFIC